MIIKKYGIELHQLQHNDIELLRTQRNKEALRSKMLDQAIISPAQQEKWFSSISNINNFYCVIQHEGKKIGLAHSKNIDWNKKEDEGGMFIWDEDYWDTGIAAKSSIIMMQLCFDIAQLKRTFAHTHQDNLAARKFNASLGYTAIGTSNKMVLTREAYKERIHKLRWIASAGKDTTPLSLSNIEIPPEQYALPQYQYLPTVVRDFFYPNAIK